MALQDILNAIVAQTDQQIAEARSAHQKKLSAMREASERMHSTKKQELAMQKEKKKQQLKAKAEAHANALKRNTLLRKKRELLDSLYSATLEKLAALPDNEIEPLVDACLKKISSKGTIQPSEKHESLLKKLATDHKVEGSVKAKGGFIFSSDTQEQDFTFEHLIQEWLRPNTELDVSKKIFN